MSDVAGAGAGDERPDWQAWAVALQAEMGHSRARGRPEAEVLPAALALVFTGWMSRENATRYIKAHTVVDRACRATAEQERDEARQERDAARTEAAGRCAQLIRDRVSAADRQVPAGGRRGRRRLAHCWTERVGLYLGACRTGVWAAH